MVSKTGFSLHSGEAKRRSLFCAALAVAPSILPQDSRPLLQASAPAVIHAMGSAALAAETFGNGSSGFRPCAQCSIIICWARPITQVQCCQSSRLGNGGVVVSLLMASP